MTTNLNIGRRLVGPDHPCYIIAEVGTTCLGDRAMALELISVAADIGVDAIKFQMIDPQQDIREDKSYPLERNGKISSANMRDMFSKLSFESDVWRDLIVQCNRSGIEFLSTVDFLSGVDFLDSLGIAAHKIGAWDTTYKSLIERIGRTEKPMLVDLGPTTQEELEDLSDWYYSSGGTAIIFLHDFHTSEFAEMNMRALRYLRKSQTHPVGFSSPNRNNDLDILCLGLGADVIEKRLILDRNIEAFHAHESLEPGEFSNWVSRIRCMESALGSEAIIPSKKDRENSRDYYRSICTCEDLSAGDRFSEKNINCRRPGTGIAAAEFQRLIGRKAKRSIRANTVVSWDDIV